MISRVIAGSRTPHYLLFAILLWVFLVKPWTVSGDVLKPGDKAPSLLGNDAISGDRLNLNLIMSQLQFKRDDRGFLVRGEDGKYINEFIRNVVVLNFFSRTCIPCIREIPFFNDIAHQYKNRRVVFLYINVDPDLTPEQAKRFITSHAIDVPMMLCNQAEAIRKYDVHSLPRVVVIDQQKQIFHIIRGFDENLEAELSRLLDTLLEKPIEP